MLYSWMFMPSTSVTEMAVFGVIKAIPGSLATPNARLRIADFRGCTANRSVLCPVTIDSSSAVGVRNGPMKKKHVSRLNDIMTYIQYIYILLLLLLLLYQL